jgi:hypothetical protein
LLVIDPGVDPLGNPAVITKPGADGKLRVDIPPTVIVHRYYYTGDRNFQGPLLPGGPSIIVVNHPKTGERLYLEVQMLPGAPRVCYTGNCIEYDYGKQGITICFDHNLLGKPCENPKIVYRNHKPALRVAGAGVAGVAKAAGHITCATGVGDLAGHVVDHTKNLAVATACAVKETGKAILTPAIVVVEMLPGVKALESASADCATKQRDDAVQRAASATKKTEATIRTLR